MTVFFAAQSWLTACHAGERNLAPRTPSSTKGIDAVYLDMP